ncbi:hypothetical protein FD723_05555 [Nostoc sp. C052]|uniref:hypothetical protein n=1 Tax=Nostoc sp. C052 TaxID=2576902 RepID=UPI0015C3F2F7|nr:hypothetical protein [Nostoc sp. C052]QLE39979.1 hypothetical protein FD723_05555 [Nostoc sp. C052]
MLHWPYCSRKCTQEANPPKERYQPSISRQSSDDISEDSNPIYSFFGVSILVVSIYALTHHSVPNSANTSTASSVKNLAVDTYRADKFTISLGEDTEKGKTYRGCDDKGSCINLKNGKVYLHDGYRDVKWKNGEYSYQVTWRENSSKPLYVNVYKNNSRIRQIELKPG